MNTPPFPALPMGRPCFGLSPHIAPSAWVKWHPMMSASDQDNHTISLFEVIGQNPSGKGVTATQVGALLQRFRGADVTVNLHSPGGDMFEGLAIYQQLRDYRGKVTVKIMGLAASAASLVAIAGDEIQIGSSAFVMIHNCWGCAVGNRHDFKGLSEKMAPFDVAMRAVYATRTGLDEATIGKMMDKETWMNAPEAIEKGFADTLLPADRLPQGDESPPTALRSESPCNPDDTWAQLQQALCRFTSTPLTLEK